MALKRKIKTLEEVDEGLRAMYRKVGEEFVLDVEGGDPDADSRVQEFRSNNIKLMKEKTDLEAKLKSFEGVDPEVYKKLMEDKQKLEDQQLLDSGKVEELLTQRTERMVKDFESKVKSLQAALDKEKDEKTKLHSQLTEVLIDSKITQAVGTIGVTRKGALEDILNRGRGVWKLEDGKPVARKGEQLLYGKDPSKLITFEEWVQDLASECPYFFEGASGSGSQGGDSGRSSSGTASDLMKLPASERLHRLHSVSGPIK